MQKIEQDLDLGNHALTGVSNITPATGRDDEVRTGLGAVGLTGNETIAGNKTFTGTATFTGGVSFTGAVFFAGNVSFTALPTADPIALGQLWLDVTTLKISAG